MEHLETFIDYIAKITEIIGVLTIFLGSIFELGKFLYRLRSDDPITYKDLRHKVGKAILLGLEILVAADIIATVVTEPSLMSVYILAIIVLIRTFLSLSLQVELEGKFPWQKRQTYEDL